MSNNDGNQQPSGLRGDPVAPRGQEDGSATKSSALSLSGLLPAGSQEGWQPIETAPKDEGQQVLLYGTFAADGSSIPRHRAIGTWFQGYTDSWLVGCSHASLRADALDAPSCASRREGRRQTVNKEEEFVARGQPQLIRAWGSTAATD